MAATATREQAQAALKELKLPTNTQDNVVIRAAGLTKTFGDEPVVQDVTFEIPRGTIFGFIGPSGSGKTTTVRLLTGVMRPTAGEVTVLGEVPVKFHRRTRERIGYMPQLFVLYPELTVWENLNFAASLYGMGLVRGKRLNQVLDFVELTEHKGKLARNISGGMQRRLSLAATLVNDAELLFLDEPTAGIDPVLRRKFWDHFRELQNQGRTLFVTTQYVGEAAYCDLIGVLAQGRILAVDTPHGLRQRAYGGDVVDVTTAEYMEFALLQRLQELPSVRGRIERMPERGLRLIVQDVSTAVPALVEWFKAQNIAVESIKEYLPPFDDVFVELVKEQPLVS